MGAVIVSGAISIWMAYSGMGVWAMVGQQIAYYLALMMGTISYGQLEGLSRYLS